MEVRTEHITHWQILKEGKCYAHLESESFRKSEKSNSKACWLSKCKTLRFTQQQQKITWAG